MGCLRCRAVQSVLCCCAWWRGLKGRGTVRLTQLRYAACPHVCRHGFEPCTYCGGDPLQPVHRVCGKHESAQDPRYFPGVVIRRPARGWPKPHASFKATAVSPKFYPSPGGVARAGNGGAPMGPDHSEPSHVSLPSSSAKSMYGTCAENPHGVESSTTSTGCHFPRHGQSSVHTHQNPGLSGCDL